MTVAFLFMGATDSYGWIFIDQDVKQPPVVMVDSGPGISKPLEIYVDHRLLARTATSYLMELRADREYHLEIRHGEKRLFKSDISLSMGREMVLKCRGKKGCLVDL